VISPYTNTDCLYEVLAKILDYLSLISLVLAAMFRPPVDEAETSSHETEAEA